jgi:hypothetical protein
MKMKFRFRIGAVSALFFVANAFAQTSQPGNTSQQAAQTKTAASLASPSPSPTAPPSLIPPNILPAPSSLPQPPIAADLAALNALFQKTSLGNLADERRFHVRTVALEDQIRNDPDLHALLADAKRAPTDLERRHRLKTYYHAYYNKLRALAAPDLKTYLDQKEATKEIALLQPHVRHQTDEAQATALAQNGHAGPTATPLPVAIPTPPPPVLPRP